MPKSSPVDSSFFSWARQTALMSVPSEPSGHTPKTQSTNSSGNCRDMEPHHAGAGHGQKNKTRSFQQNKTTLNPGFRNKGQKNVWWQLWPLVAPSPVYPGPSSGSPAERCSAFLCGSCNNSLLCCHHFGGPVDAWRRVPATPALNTMSSPELLWGCLAFKAAGGLGQWVGAGS